MYSPKILLLVFRSLLIFSLPLIFTLLAASISHFRTAAMTCFCCNEIRLLCLQTLALTLSLLPTWVYTSKIMSKKTRLCCCFFSLKVLRPCVFLPNKTLSCIWVAIPLDWVIFHWRACVADGWAVGLVDVWSCDYQNFSDALVTEFSYSWCSAARASRARELRYEHLSDMSLSTLELDLTAFFAPSQKLRLIAFLRVNRSRMRYSFRAGAKAIWYIACKRCLNLGDIALLTLVALFGNSRRVTGKWLKKNFHAGWQEMNLAAKKNRRKAIDAVWSSSVSDDSGKRTALLSNLETNRMHSR